MAVEVMSAHIWSTLLVPSHIFQIESTSSVTWKGCFRSFTSTVAPSGAFATLPRRTGFWFMASRGAVLGGSGVSSMSSMSPRGIQGPKA
jgi:hypothetical protein